MNRGILTKALREVWPATLLFAVGLFVFHIILAVVLPAFFADMMGPLAENPVFLRVLRGILGPIGDRIGPEAILSFAWVHPVVLTLVWAHEITFCTRVPAGEVDRGTIDVLFGLPVSRWQIYRSESAVWLVTGLVLMAAQLGGNLLGGAGTSSPHGPPLSRVLLVVVNQFGLYVAVGGLAYLVSALSDRRGRAVAVVFALVLVSFFWHVLAQFWPPAGTFGFLGVLYYYRPHEILQGAGAPLGNTAVLLGLGVGLWTAAGAVLARRDICTV